MMQIRTFCVKSRNILVSLPAAISILKSIRLFYGMGATDIASAMPRTSIFSQYTERHLAFDICGICNAQCYYCQTGFANRSKISCNKKKFIDVGLFERILRYLRNKGFIEADTKIHLYNWGEPMLHPEFSKIIEIATKEHCWIALSTNAAVLPKLANTFDASNIGFIKFSMCGFSQTSYDKIHRLDFECVKRNIETIVRTFRQHGFVGQFFIYFHVYQFNLHELQAAYDFAKTLNITCHPVFAVINDWEKLKHFLQGTLSRDYLNAVARDLFMGYSSQSFQATHTCPMAPNLTIDPNGRCILCCLVNEDLGDVFEMTPEIWHRLHQQNKTCRECMRLGIPRLEFNAMIVDMEQLARAFALR